MKQLVLIMAIISAYGIKAQEGIVRYKHILNLDTTQTAKDNPAIPAFLYFNTNKSLYTYNRSKDTLVSASGEEQLAKGSLALNVQERDEYGDMFYKDFLQHKLIIRQLVWGEAFISQELLPAIRWEILEDIRKIGNFFCQKATTTFRGRYYEAWFTTEIPVSDGPWKFHGLPGLILEVYDKNKEVQFLFESLIIPSPVNKDLIVPQKGSRISFEEFKSIERTQSDKAVKLLQASMEEGAEMDISINVYPIEKEYE